MRKIALLLMFALALVGCQAGEEFAEIQFPTETIQIVAEPIIVTGPSEAEIQAEIEAKAKIAADKKAAEEKAKADLVTVSETQTKFNEYIADTNDFRGSFNADDCENGLVSMSEKYFSKIDDLIEDDLSGDVDDAIENDMEDGVEEDLSDYRADFKKIDYSDISTSKVNYTKFNTSVLAEFNDTFNEIDDIINFLEDAKDFLEDEDDYEDAEEEIEDAIDALEDDLDDALKDLKDELKDFEDDLRDEDENDYDDVADDVEKVVDDISDLESDVNKIASRLKDLREIVINTVDNYDDQDDIQRNFDVMCK